MPSAVQRIVFLIAVLGYAGIGMAGGPNVEDKYAAGALRGVTRDPDGHLLPQARVTVHNVADGSDVTVASGSDGAFVIPSLTPGQYQVSARAEGFATLAAAAVTVTIHQTTQMDLSLARSAPDADLSPAIAKALEAMQKRIEQLEAEVKNRNTQEPSQAAAAEVPSKLAEGQPRTLLATIAKEPGAIPIEPGTLNKREPTLVASTAVAPSSTTDLAQQAGKAPAHASRACRSAQPDSSGGDASPATGPCR